LSGSGLTGGDESIFGIDSVTNIVIEINGRDNIEGFTTNGNFSFVFFDPSFIDGSSFIVSGVFII
jgi:acetyltransferase-like isoleucine patch superfamily enzyme